MKTSIYPSILYLALFMLMNILQFSIPLVKATPVAKVKGTLPSNTNGNATLKEVRLNDNIYDLSQFQHPGPTNLFEEYKKYGADVFEKNFNKQHKGMNPESAGAKFIRKI